MGENKDRMVAETTQCDQICQAAYLTNLSSACNTTASRVSRSHCIAFKDYPFPVPADCKSLHFCGSKFRVAKIAMQLSLSTFHGARLQSACTTRRIPSDRGLHVIALQPIQGKVISTQMGKTAVVQVRLLKRRCT